MTTSFAIFDEIIFHIHIDKKQNISTYIEDVCIDTFHARSRAANSNTVGAGKSRIRCFDGAEVAMELGGDW